MADQQVAWCIYGGGVLAGGAVMLALFAVREYVRLQAEERRVRAAAWTR